MSHRFPLVLYWGLCMGVVTSTRNFVPESKVGIFGQITRSRHRNCHVTSELVCLFAYVQLLARMRCRSVQFRLKLFDPPKRWLPHR
jgi:hypothetical protein